MASGTHTHGSLAHGSKAAELVQKAEQETKPLQTFFMKFNNDWSMNFAGALAYSLLTAILPIVIAIISVLGFILGSNAKQIIPKIVSILPKGTSGQALQASIGQLSQGAGFLALISVVLAIFGGSRLFIAIEGCLDIVYRVRPRTPIRQNVIAISMMILFIVLTPIMIFASALPNIILSFIGNNPAATKIPLLDAIAKNPLITNLTGIAGGLITAFILFEAIYVIVPNQRISWRNSWRGALISAVALELFLTVIFPFYSTHFMKNYVGQIGFAVILLVFFYYFAVILMLGAEINAFFFEGVHPLPNDLATFVSTMAGRLQHDIPDVEGQAHINPKPTVMAEKAYIAEKRLQEEQTQQANASKQQKIVAKAQVQERDKAKTQKAKQPGKGLVALEVVAGSLLAMGIELLRLRHRGK